MKRRIAIHGLGAVGGFGAGTEALRQALGSDIFRASSALRADTAPLAEYVSARQLRRMGHFSRMALLGACSAWRDGQALGLDRRRTGVVIASGYGAAATTFAFLDSVLDDGCALASPTRFSGSLHNVPAAHISMILGIDGPTLTVTQFEMSVSSALLTASVWLWEERVDAVLVGGVDEYCAVLGYCRERMFPHSDEPPRPLDFERHTAIAGEGAGFMLLTRDEGELPRYGFIDEAEWGILKPDAVLGTAEGLTIIGADGHARCGMRYAKHLNPQARVRAYAGAYGSFPAAHALDLVSAALKLPEEKTICCIKLSGEGEFSIISLSA